MSAPPIAAAPAENSAGAVLFMPSIFFLYNDKIKPRQRAGRLFLRLRNAYSSTALMRRTPAEEDCSLTILKCPSSPVDLACGPPHISREKVPME